MGDDENDIVEGIVLWVGNVYVIVVIVIFVFKVIVWIV